MIHALFTQHRFPCKKIIGFSPAAAVPSNVTLYFKTSGYVEISDHKGKPNFFSIYHLVSEKKQHTGEICCTSRNKVPSIHILT